MVRGGVASALGLASDIHALVASAVAFVSDTCSFLFNSCHLSAITFTDNLVQRDFIPLTLDCTTEQGSPAVRVTVYIILDN